MSLLQNWFENYVFIFWLATFLCLLGFGGVIVRHGNFVNTVPPVPDGRFRCMKRKWYQALMLSNPVGSLVQTGYKVITKVAEKPFVVRYWGKPYVILPAKPEYLSDMRKADRAHLSFIDNMSDLFFLYNWVKDLFTSERMVYVIIRGLNPNLPYLTDAVINEADYAFKAQFGDCKEATSFPAFPTLMNLSIRMGARVILGDGFCRNEPFIAEVENYFNWNFITGVIALKLPLGPFRDTLGWPLWRLQQWRLSKTIAKLSPYVQMRIDQEKSNKHDATKIDGLSGMIKILKTNPVEDNVTPPLWRITHEMIQLLWAAGHSPGSALTQMVFSILEHTSYLPILRKEAEEAIALYGWTEKAFSKLPVQDSYIREVNRLYPTFSLNATRTVMKVPFTFSDGLTLPVGTRIALPAQAIQRDSEFCRDPLEFDGFRFIKLAQADARQDDGVNIWAASNSGKTNLSFGYGNHACPGRFLAVRMLKVVFTKLILEYDVSWDRADPGQPSRFSMEGISTPNVTQNVKLKKRVL
ncbi:cytochrome P450 [Amylocarpus encephaloides]|uniref:Cytochrome P450 n=1 Tax=Amylocarpus encephaloides TaxID=45428 RepID=A0A9P8C2H0_9HELO|nr:cytochrome P450 [Amylocarpus encephaloides]